MRYVSTSEALLSPALSAFDKKMSPLAPRFTQIATRDSCGQTTFTYQIIVRMQLLFVSAGIIAGIWWHDIKPKIERVLQTRNGLTIKKAVCERINAHEMQVAFVFTVSRDNDTLRLIERDADQLAAGGSPYHSTAPFITRFCDITVMTSSEETIMTQQKKNYKTGRPNSLKYCNRKGQSTTLKECVIPARHFVLLIFGNRPTGGKNGYCRRGQNGYFVRQ